MDDEARQELKRQIVLAKADVAEKQGSLLNDIDLVYQDPMEACQRITRFVGNNGEKALITKLEKDPAFFGGTKGHLGSGKFLTLEGSSERKIAKEYAMALPAKAVALQKAENKLYDLQRGLHGPGGGPGFTAAKSKEKGGPDFH